VRTDRWVFPGSLVKQRVREAEAAITMEEEGPAAAVSPRAHGAEAGVQQKLKHKAHPQVRAVDLSWSLDEKLVRFFTHSAKSIERCWSCSRRPSTSALVWRRPTRSRARRLR